MQYVQAECAPVNSDYGDAVFAEAVPIENYVEDSGKRQQASAAPLEFNSQYEHQTFPSPASVPVVSTPNLTQQNSPHLNTSPPPTLEPSYEPSPTSGWLSQQVELFENERYSPRLGFSPKGLLITDRGTISNGDGTVNFASIGDATSQLSLEGWRWVEDDWQMSVFGHDVSLSTATADQGWLYNSDFSGYGNGNSGHAKKGMTHFARRRRLTRTMIFDEYSVGEGPPVTCQNCDLGETERLAQLLLDTYHAALLTRYPSKDVKEQKYAKVKVSLVQALFARGHARSFSFDAIAQQMGDFSKGQQSASLLRRQSAVSLRQVQQQQSTQDPFARSVAEHFCLEERLGLARQIIRRFDSVFEHHCQVPMCGTNCAFAAQRCPNAGCTVTFSRRWWSQHDQLCPFKIVPCALQCGSYLARNACPDHAQNHCVMRPVPCPFARMGCCPPGLIFKDVETHCNLNCAYHLSLAVPFLQTKEARLRELGTIIPQATMEIHLIRQAILSGR